MHCYYFAYPDSSLLPCTAIFSRVINDEYNAMNVRIIHMTEIRKDNDFGEIMLNSKKKK